MTPATTHSGDDMGKRTDFKRVPRDYYKTPESAVLPLLPHLKMPTYFVEPCAGDGALVDVLHKHGHIPLCPSDIEPMRSDIEKLDVADAKPGEADCFITNPPWSWPLLRSIIENLSAQRPTWLLLNADLAHNKRMIPYMARCVKIVSVGRVSWMGNGVSGYENCAWYLFDVQHRGTTTFFPRADK